MKTVVIKTPVSGEVIERLSIRDRIEIHGKIYTGRDAVLPRLRRMIEENRLGTLGVNLSGAVIMHAGYSCAGFGPTTSNKKAIESSIPALARAGVKIHVGKGSLSESTAKLLEQFKSIFAVTPPVTAILMHKVVSSSLVAFAEEGMEAMYELDVSGLPAIVAIAHNESIYRKRLG